MPPSATKILVIDDNPDDRELFRRALDRCDNASYVVSEAEDGDKGLEAAKTVAADCILLDYSLPGRNGVEVLKRLRNNHPFVPVVMLTGQGNEAIAVSAMREGAQNYITKSSISSEQIHHVVQLAIIHCEMARRLHQQRQSLELFTRALAHDLKEPIRTIKSFLELLRAHNTFTERAQRFFEHISNAADRMAALIDAVHFYTGLDRGADNTEKTNCSFETILKEALFDLGELVREREAIVTAGPLPHVFANGPQLRQVVQNLVCNAIRHAHLKPLVRITAFEEPDTWLFRLTDNGPGVDANMREKIFQPFTRLSQDRHGLGLGLAICKHIIENHGGQIWCEAGESSEGAVFAFRLPKPLHEIDTTSDQTDNSLATVLVVDDNEVDIELTRILLLEEEKFGCNMISATSATEALGILRNRADIDLVLLDINMPNVDGFELLQRIRDDKRLALLPVLICTTSEYSRDIERASELGATGYVTKPPRLRKLSAEIAKISSLLLRPRNDTFDLLQAPSRPAELGALIH